MDLSRNFNSIGRSTQQPGRVHRASVNGSIASSTGVGKRFTLPEFEFNLGNAKAGQMKKLADSTPGSFKKLFNSSLYDSLLNNLILYFTAAFQYESLQKTSERAKKQHLDGYNSVLMCAKLRELQEEALSLRQSLGPLYGQILIQYSDYTKGQKDRKFFEALYTSLQELLESAFSKVGKKAAIAAELGLMFRSRHFNREQRMAAPPRSVDTLTVTELHAVKTEGVNRALNSRAIAALYEKPHQLAVQTASFANTPLIGSSISSPLVAKGMMMDPLQRKMLLSRHAAPPGAGGDGFGASAQGAAELKGAADQEGTAFGRHPAASAISQDLATAAACTRLLASTAPAQATSTSTSHSSPLTDPETTLGSTGVFGNRASLRSPQLSVTAATTVATAALAAAATTAASLMAEGSSPRHTRIHSESSTTMMGGRSGGVAMPETAGLLHDETYYYLALLRRYVLYGPTMGLTTPAGAFGAAKGSILGATSAMLGQRASTASLGSTTPTNEARASSAQVGRA